MMTEPHHIEEVRDYLVSPHVQGFNYLMFLTKIDNQYYNLLISKKELRYNRIQNKATDIKIYTFKMRCSKPFYYEDTIFDGKIIKTGTYLIYDCYTMCGQGVTTMDMCKKHQLIKTMVAEMSMCKIDSVQLFEQKDLPRMLKEYDAHTLNGIVFLPKQSSKWYIYVNEAELTQFKHGQVKPTNNKSQQEFIMRKTDIPDVYELYLENGQKEGIAAIPNMKISHYCRNAIKNNDNIKMTCIKSVKFNKWIPLCQSVDELAMVIF
jgi:hypothetical protein